MPKVMVRLSGHRRAMWSDNLATKALVATAMASAIGTLSASAARAKSHAVRSVARLEADKEAIERKIQLYSLLHDGDGIRSDARAWADAIFTTDATFQVHWPDGTLLVPNQRPGIIGRENILRIFGSRPQPFGGPIARHILGVPVFDRIDARQAQTRTLEQVLHGVPTIRPPSGDKPAAVQPAIDVYIFHDSWRKDADGQWRKTRMEVYCVLNCIPFSLPKDVLQ